MMNFDEFVGFSSKFIILISLSPWTQPDRARNTPRKKIKNSSPVFPRKSTNPLSALRRRDAAGARRPIGVRTPGPRSGEEKNLLGEPMSTANFIRVKKTEPCPICGKTDWCMVSRDRAVALCARVSAGSFKRTKGGYCHRLSSDSFTTMTNFDKNRTNRRSSSSLTPDAGSPMA